MDVDEFFFPEDSNLEKIKELNDLLLKKNESFIKLKKKIVATSSILALYKDMKNECDNLKKCNFELNDKNTHMMNQHKEFLLEKISRDKETALLKCQYENLLEKHKTIEDQDNGKAATIKQLRDYASELKSKLDCVEIESELLKTKAKEDVEILRKDLKSLKSEHKTEIRIICDKLINISTCLKSLKRELRGRCSVSELKYFKAIFDELNQLKVSKFNLFHKNKETFKQFDEDNILALSPASPDTGKGSSVCTSDDEKSVTNIASLDKNSSLSSISIEPYTCEPDGGPGDGDMIASLHCNSQDNCTTSPTKKRNRKYIKSTSPSKIKSLANKQKSFSNTMLHAEGEINAKSFDDGSEIVETYNDDYVASILNRMTRSVIQLSPLSWNHLDNTDNFNKLQQPLNSHVCKYSCIRKKRKLNTKNLSAIIKHAVKVEVRNLLKMKSVKNRKINDTSGSNSGVILRKKLLSTSIKLSKMKLSHLGNKLNQTNKVYTRKDVSKVTLSDSKVINKYLKRRNLGNSRIKNVKSKDVCTKSDQDVENDRRIDHAKKVLMDCKENINAQNKTFVKWRTGASITDMSLVREDNDLDRDDQLKSKSDTIEDVKKISIKSPNLRKRKTEKRKSNITSVGETNNRQVSNNENNDINLFENDTTDVNTQELDSIEADDIISTEPVSNVDTQASTSEPDLPHFRFLLSEHLKSPKNTVNSPKNVTNTNLGHDMETFLCSEFTVEDMDVFVENLNQESELNIVHGIIEFISSSNRYNDVTYHNYPILPLTRSHQAVLVLINKLSCSSSPKANITELLMKGIEYKIFKLNETPPLKSLQNMTPLYVALCRLTKQKDRLKLFCFDALYCLSYSASPIIYLILQCWPALFPKSTFISAHDPLFVTMVHFLLSNFSINTDYNGKKLQHLLFHKYGYKTGEHTDSSVLQLLCGHIKSNKVFQFNSLLSAFLLLGKKTGVEWCYNNIIHKTLIPIMDDPEESSTCKALAIRIIGPLTRPFPVEKTLQCEILFKKLLNYFDKSGDPCMDESVVSSLHYFKRKNFTFYKMLLNWKPKYPLSKGMVQVLKEIMNDKSRIFWSKQIQQT